MLIAAHHMPQIRIQWRPIQDQGQDSHARYWWSFASNTADWRNSQYVSFSGSRRGKGFYSHIAGRPDWGSVHPQDQWGHRVPRVPMKQRAVELHSWMWVALPAWKVLLVVIFILDVVLLPWVTALYVEVQACWTVSAELPWLGPCWCHHVWSRTFYCFRSYKTW